MAPAWVQLKIDKRAVDFFPFPVVARALSVFPLPSLPTTQRDLCGRERYSEQWCVTD